MWPDLLHLSLPVADLAVRGVVVYLAVLLLLRVAGKRQLAQLSPVEFVAILLISNAVQNAMNGGDNSLTGGLLLAGVLVATSWLVTTLAHRSPAAKAALLGSPVLLVHKGRIVEDRLRAERIAPQELRAMLRRQGIQHLSDVHAAVLEADGTLAITHKADLLPRPEEPAGPSNPETPRG